MRTEEKPLNRRLGERPAISAYDKAAKKTALRMQEENASEHKRLSDKATRKLLRGSIKLANPHLSGVELDKLVDQYLPRAMSSYRGPVHEASKSPTGRDLYEAERRRIVRANRHNRR